jgi:hypothetical protein
MNAAHSRTADPERGRQHLRHCLHQHDWADWRGDRNNHHADRLERSDGILHLSASAIAAGCPRNVRIDAQAILRPAPLEHSPEKWETGFRKDHAQKDKR